LLNCSGKFWKEKVEILSIHCLIYKVRFCFILTEVLTLRLASVIWQNKKRRMLSTSQIYYIQVLN